MRDMGRNVMRTVKLDKKELLDIVKENLKQHIAIFNEAVEDYKILVLKISKENLKLAKTGDLEVFKKIELLPTAPISYAKDYERAIRMLELSVDDVIELTEDVFNQLVLDEWGWKNQFTASALLYKTR